MNDLFRATWITQGPAPVKSYTGVILILVRRSADRILSTTSGSRDKLQDDQRAVKEISSQVKEKSG